MSQRWSSLWAGGTLSGDGQTVSAMSGMNRATAGITGKSYFEFNVISAGGLNANQPGLYAHDAVFGNPSVGGQLNITNFGSNIVYASSVDGVTSIAADPIALAYFVDGDVIGVAVDSTGALAHISINGTWSLTGDPATGPGVALASGKTWFPGVTGSGTSVRLETQALTYPIPPGYDRIPPAWDENAYTGLTSISNDRRTIRAQTAFATDLMDPAGKYYLELEMVSGGSGTSGAFSPGVTARGNLNDGVWHQEYGSIEYWADNSLRTNTAGTLGATDNWGFFVDLPANKMFVRLNGTWIFGGDPDAGGAGMVYPGTFSTASALYTAALRWSDNNQTRLRAHDPVYSIPTGAMRLGDPLGATAIPTALTVPTISDTTPVVGQSVTATRATYDQPVDSYADQWYADGSPISGANSLGFTLTSSEAGKVLAFGETPTNTYGAGVENVSADTSVVQLAPVVITVTATGAYSFALTSTELPNGTGKVTKVEAWGPGAGGARRGRGSGGGAFALSDNGGAGWTVATGDTLYGSVPAATTGTSATTGSTPSGDSWARADGTNAAPSTAAQGALAKAGSAGTSTVNGAGGTTAASVGTTKYAGGAGGNTGSGTTLRGAGGGGAGSGGAGGNASGATQGAAGATDGGLGGASSTGTSVAAAAAPGGGGGAISGASGNGGTGGRGQIRFTIQPDLPSGGSTISAAALSVSASSAQAAGAATAAQAARTVSASVALAPGASTAAQAAQASGAAVALGVGAAVIAVAAQASAGAVALAVGAQVAASAGLSVSASAARAPWLATAAQAARSVSVSVATAGQASLAAQAARAVAASIALAAQSSVSAQAAQAFGASVTLGAGASTVARAALAVSVSAGIASTSPVSTVSGTGLSVSSSSAVASGAAVAARAAQSSSASVALGRAAATAAGGALSVSSSVALGRSAALAQAAGLSVSVASVLAAQRSTASVAALSISTAFVVGRGAALSFEAAPRMVLRAAISIRTLLTGSIATERRLKASISTRRRLKGQI